MKIENYYEGVSRFNFNELCSRNLGAEDYLEIAKLIKFMVIDEIPQFDNANSNQQHRFITLIDVIYEKYTNCSHSKSKSRSIQILFIS